MTNGPRVAGNSPHPPGKSSTRPVVSQCCCTVFWGLTRAQCPCENSTRSDAPSANAVWHENAGLESCHLDHHDRRKMGMCIPRQPPPVFPTCPSRRRQERGLG